MPSCGGFGAGLTARGTGLAAGLGGGGFGLVCAGLVCDAATRGAAAVVIVVTVVATTVATASTRSDFMVITERYPSIASSAGAGNSGIGNASMNCHMLAQFSDLERIEGKK